MRAWIYVISSHVIEHFFDPIQAIEEWMRTLKPGGIVFMIVPHKERTIDRDRDITTLEEHIQRHEGKLNITDYAHLDAPYAHQRDHKVMDDSTKNNSSWIPYKKDDHHHWSVWTTEAFENMCEHFWAQHYRNTRPRRQSWQWFYHSAKEELYMKSFAAMA